MLVFTRREGEQIVIGEDIVISVERIGREKVSIGITAPQQVAVDRLEVRMSMDAEGRRRKP